ncbi:hypothetical protein ATCC90586_010588 [Pythium insidiosum]|nr:hypothetical protein ATCC90586_010588 [Pythium insidiosum]
MAMADKAAPLATYLVLALRGLESLVVEEIQATLQVDELQVCSVEADPQQPHVNVFQGEAAVGRILLRTRSPPRAVRSLRSAQAILAFLASSDDIVTGDKSGVDQVAGLIADADWTSALELWHAHMRELRPNRFPDASLPSRPLFRGSCVRDGRHAFQSVDIAGEIGAVLIERFGWQVDLVNCDLEVVCLLFHRHMIAGIALSNPADGLYKNRIVNEPRPFLADSKYVSTLRPSTAYLMLQLARYEPGDVVLDSMCGVGTIPICGADFSSNEVFALGGELDALPVEKAGRNARTAPRLTDVCQWDSTRLPLRSATVDRVVIDLPFGNRCSNPRAMSKVYPKVMKELYRVLRPHGGRAVLLTTLRKTFQNAALQAAPFTLLQTVEVSIGGMSCCIYVLEKRSAA